MKTKVLIVPAHKNLAKMTANGVQHPEVDPEIFVKNCAALIERELAEDSKLHFLYIPETGDYETVLNAILGFGRVDTEPTVVIFDGTIDDVNLLSKYLTVELGDGYEVEGRDANLGNGTRIFLATKDFHPKVKLWDIKLLLPKWWV